MVEVFFDNIHSQIIRRISEAKTGIKICVAWFTDVDIYQSILVAQKRGVNVCIIIANHEFNKNSRVDFKELLQNNGYVGYIGNINDGAEDKLMHNKFCIIDEQKIITGSYNWTYKARKNDENIIIIENESEIIKEFNSKFESIKPQYGFAVQENKVELLPIESIVAKWDNQPNLPVPKVTMKFDVDIISKKF
jgi:phosphatidylserine/phosphatidylglycerophosphate/cardiolipin synthase-like enzyme